VPNLGSHFHHDDDDDDEVGAGRDYTSAASLLVAAILPIQTQELSQYSQQQQQHELDDNLQDRKVLSFWNENAQEDEISWNNSTSSHSPQHHSFNATHVRGGSSTSTRASATVAPSRTTKPTHDLLAGTKSSIQTSLSYWSDAFQQLQKKLVHLFPNKKKKHDEIDLTTIPVQDVQAPTSTILPPMVVKRAAQRSGMVGSVMTADRVNECARQLKQWYVQRGYVLHSVTGATLHAENGTATLAVQEPIVSDVPLDIKFAKEMLIDPDTGETLTRRKYREKLERVKGRPLRREEWVSISDQLNTTLVESKGRTNARTISRRLGLEAGRHFCWNGDRWQRIAQSGIFSKIWRTSPVQMGDGTVQLQVLCQESPPRNLEYGISKSLYTGNWVSCAFQSQWQFTISRTVDDMCDC
jgi:hypothetical protein